MSKPIYAEEVAAVLRDAAAGRCSVRLSNPQATWEAVFAGDIEFRIGDWLITIFNDCDEVDYVDNVVSPDGRSAEYYDWADAGGGNPLDLLEAATIGELYEIFANAR